MRQIQLLTLGDMQFSNFLSLHEVLTPEQITSIRDVDDITHGSLNITVFLFDPIRNTIRSGRHHNFRYLAEKLVNREDSLEITQVLERSLKGWWVEEKTTLVMEGPRKPTPGEYLAIQRMLKINPSHYCYHFD